MAKKVKATPAAKETKPATKAAKAPAAPPVAAQPAKATGKGTAKGPAPAAATPAKAPAAAAPAAKPQAGPPGVASRKTKLYLAGLVIKRHGLAAGVTDAMVEELDALAGKPCPVQSRYDLKNAWHAIHAFTDAQG